MLVQAVIHVTLDASHLSLGWTGYNLRSAGQVRHSSISARHSPIFRQYPLFFALRSRLNSFVWRFHLHWAFGIGRLELCNVDEGRTILQMETTRFTAYPKVALVYEVKAVYGWHRIVWRRALKLTGDSVVTRCFSHLVLKSLLSSKHRHILTALKPASRLSRFGKISFANCKVSCQDSRKVDIFAEIRCGRLPR